MGRVILSDCNWLVFVELLLNHLSPRFAYFAFLFVHGWGFKLKGIHASVFAVLAIIFLAGVKR